MLPSPTPYNNMAKSTKNHCTFFLKGKGRYCRLEAVKGTPYCGEHMLSGGVVNCYLDQIQVVYNL